MAGFRHKEDKEDLGVEGEGAGASAGVKPKTHILLRAYNTPAVADKIRKLILSDPDGLIGSFTVVTNSSRDDIDPSTVQILEGLSKEFPGRSIECIPLKNDEHGWSKALNAGVQAIKGKSNSADYITCLSNEADATIDHIALMTKVLDANPTAPASYPLFDMKPGTRYGLGYQVPRNTCMTWRRSIFDAHEFNNDLDNHGGMEDYALALKVFEASPKGEKVFPLCTGQRVPVSVRVSDQDNITPEEAAKLREKGTYESGTVMKIADGHCPKTIRKFHKCIDANFVEIVRELTFSAGVPATVTQYIDGKSDVATALVTPTRSSRRLSGSFSPSFSLPNPGFEFGMSAGNLGVLLAMSSRLVSPVADGHRPSTAPARFIEGPRSLKLAYEVLGEVEEPTPKPRRDALALMSVLSEPVGAPNGEGHCGGVDAPRSLISLSSVEADGAEDELEDSVGIGVCPPPPLRRVSTPLLCRSPQGSPPGSPSVDNISRSGSPVVVRG